jgi:hypothetical protein
MVQQWLSRDTRRWFQNTWALRTGTHLLQCKWKAAMARPEDSESDFDYSKDKSVIVMDCRASVTITGSLLNCEDVELKITDWDCQRRWKHYGIAYMQKDAFCEKQIGRSCLNHYVCDLRERISTRSTWRKIAEQSKDLSDSGWRSRHQWPIPIGWKLRTAIQGFNSIHKWAHRSLLFANRKDGLDTIGANDRLWSMA